MSVWSMTWCRCSVPEWEGGIGGSPYRWVYLRRGFGGLGQGRDPRLSSCYAMHAPRFTLLSIVIQDTQVAWLVYEKHRKTTKEKTRSSWSRGFLCRSLAGTFPYHYHGISAFETKRQEARAKRRTAKATWKKPSQPEPESRRHRARQENSLTLDPNPNPVQSQSAWHETIRRPLRVCDNDVYHTPTTTTKTTTTTTTNRRRRGPQIGSRPHDDS